MTLVEQISRKMVEYFDDMLIITDEQFRIIYINNNASRILKKEIDHLLESNLNVVLPEDMMMKINETVLTLNNPRSEYFRSALFTEGSKPIPISYRFTVCEIENNLYYYFRLHDISQIQMMEDDISDIEARYKILFEQNIVGVAEIEIEHARFLHVNQKYCDTLGYSRDELLAVNVKSITYPDDIEKKDDFVREMLAGKINEFQLETRYLTKSDQFIWVHLTVESVKQKRSTKNRYFSIIQDISQQKKFEEDLAKYRERLNIIEKYSKIGLWERYLDSDFAWGTREAFKIWGYDRPTGEIHNSLITAVIDDWSNVEKDMLKALEEKGEYSMERVIHPADGSAPKVVISTGKLIPDENGGPLKVTGIIHDVTELRKLKEDLQVALDQNLILQEFIHRSSQPMAIGHIDNSLGIHNKAFMDLIGYDESDLEDLNRIPLASTPPEYREMEKSKLEELVRTNIPTRYEKEVIRKDGTRIAVEYFVDVVKDEFGSPKFFYCFASNISDRKAAQQRLADQVNDFMALFEDIDIGAAFVKCLRDDKGDPVDYRLIKSNRPFDLLTQHQKDDSIDPLCSLKDEYGKSICFTYYESVFKTRKPVRFEIHALQLNRTFLIRAYATEPDSLITFIKDITDVKWEGVK